MSRRTTAALLAAAALAALPAAAAAAPACARPADVRAADRAARWVATLPPSSMAAGQQADAIAVLRQAGRSRAILRARLQVLARSAPAYASTPAAAAKVVLAAAAAGVDPTRVGGVDYVARIRRSYADGRFGASAFDQALSILALRSAGRPVPPAALSALRSTRGTGGWSFGLRASEPDTVDVTALVLEAMAAGGAGPRDPAVRSARVWIAAQRGRDGGFASTGGGRPAEANSTAGVVRATCALGGGRDARAVAALRRLQEADGRVRFTRVAEGSPLLATLDALPALRGTPLPAR